MPRRHRDGRGKVGGGSNGWRVREGRSKIIERMIRSTNLLFERREGGWYVVGERRRIPKCLGTEDRRGKAKGNVFSF